MISEDGYFLQPSVQSISASTNGGLVQLQDNYSNPNPNPNLEDAPAGSNNKRKRNLPRTPDPEVEVVAMSPKTLMATNRFICEICNKGFQRDQNLQLHRRGHNLPWKLKQKAKDQPIKKKVYVCPEKSCVHNDPSRALGDLTGIKKHFSRKHGEKKWKCDKCSKKYAVMSDWKAHTKICGTREYKCDCGTIFSRKDSFITHRAFCDALTEERMRVTTNTIASGLNPNTGHDLSSSLLVGNRQSIPSFSASQRPEFLGFEPSSSTSGNNSNNMGIADNTLGNKSRLPLWLDHHQVMNSDSFLASSSSIRGSSHVLLPEFSPANLNLFTSSSSSSIPQETPLLKVAEEENRGSYNHASDLFSLYSLPSSSIGNMSATALLQKAAQIGSTRINSNSTMFANVSGMMRSSSSSSPSFSSNNLANMNSSVDIFHQKQLFRQQINHQMASLQGYSTTTDPLTTTSNNKSASDGMRDFLGTLGGAARDEGNNGSVEERRVLLQEEMAYKFATMEGSHDHQEPYKDLMR